MHTWDRAPLKFTSCLNLTIQIFTWREKHVLQRYMYGLTDLIWWKHRQYGTND